MNAPQPEGNAQQQPGLRILCLDGGGLRGVIPLEFLLAIEKETGKPIRNSFDLICGTSTGGIITSAHVYGSKSINDLLNIYINLGKEVFTPMGRLQRAFNLLVRGAQHDNEALRENVVKVVGQSQLADVQTPKVTFRLLAFSYRHAINRCSWWPPTCWAIHICLATTTTRPKKALPPLL
eukprot:TRINITY_DN7605_c0_g1_i1.p1 TRINITY_DN7605_c0_g1~~TRINITY_DN7605_c0_g1_i1.p1  ORF type:complete len:179 (-),score=18.33 TRINITY_DN7605_c0_g1_i1:184-720(-)